MKLRLDKISSGEEEVIIRYKEMNEEVEHMISFLNPERRKIIGHKEKEHVVLNPKEILYIESVDNLTYAYTQENVYRTDFTLFEVEHEFEQEGFFRCSKSMVLNIWKVSSLKSLSCNRIDVTMENNEHVIISRTYAREFRRILKGGNTDE